MRELPSEKQLNELVEIAKDFEKKAKKLYEPATEIDKKWRVRLQLRRKSTLARVKISCSLNKNIVLIILFVTVRFEIDKLL
jgi:hypothetical protein